MVSPSGRRARIARGAVATLLALATWSARGAEATPADEPAIPAHDGWTMRVESELFVAGGQKPVARTLTLFRDGVAWDFLHLPPGARAAERGDAPADASLELVEIVLHDPARERIVVIDPVRHVKTTVETVRLERLGVSLATWARSSNDRLIRWAGGPEFDSGFSDTDDRLELAGPRVHYAVAHEPAPSPAAAAAYRRFADSAVLLRSLLHPGGLPPFPRLAVNRRLEAADAVPTEVTLEIEPKLGPVAGRPERMRSVHRTHPRLLAADLARIEEAEGHLAASENVDLAAFAGADASPQ